MKITVDQQYYLTEIRPVDKDAFIEYLNDEDVYQFTLRVPFPYTEKDADQWIALNVKKTKENGKPVCWAIRDSGGQLIGGCGFDDLMPGKAHRGEIGYWLARPFWGQGIMTKVVHAVCEYAFTEMDLEKITAKVFDFNQASARVLEKCGFEQEGYLKKHFKKDGSFIDARVFGRTR